MTNVDLGPRERQLVLELPIEARLSEADFLPAAGNAAALDAIRAWLRWPHPVLLLHGPAGSGKSHLLEIWRARSQARALGPDALGSSLALLPAIEGATAVAVDDADRAADERALFHLYNTVSERAGSMLLTSSRPLGDWLPVLPDLRSRLLTAWQVAILPPDDALLGAVLVKQLADRQLRVEPDVVEYLLPRMERSFAAARAMVEALDRYSLGQRGPIGIGLARSILARFGAMEEAEDRGTVGEKA